MKYYPEAILCCYDYTAIFETDEEMKSSLNRAVIVLLVLVVWQPLSQTAGGQLTTALPALNAESQSSDAAKIASSTVPASFVGLALLILSAV